MRDSDRARRTQADLPSVRTQLLTVFASDMAALLAGIIVALTETSATLKRMRILPRCNEGFRRLSLVAAITAFLVVAGYWFNNDWEDWSNRQRSCNFSSQVETDNCPRSSDKRPDTACVANVKADYAQCSAWARPTSVDNIATIFLQIVGGLTAAYLMALIVRILGWIVAGFQRA